jgi:hypothetical protein
MPRRRRETPLDRLLLAQAPARRLIPSIEERRRLYLNQCGREEGVTNPLREAIEARMRRA